MRTLMCEAATRLAADSTHCISGARATTSGGNVRVAPPGGTAGDDMANARASRDANCDPGLGAPQYSCEQPYLQFTDPYNGCSCRPRPSRRVKSARVMRWRG